MPYIQTLNQQKPMSKLTLQRRIILRLDPQLQRRLRVDPRVYRPVGAPVRGLWDVHVIRQPQGLERARPPRQVH